MKKIINTIMLIVIIAYVLNAIPANPELFLSFDGDLNGGMNNNVCA